jgi:tetratricopeptide (TPR) repeat protein
MRSFVPRAALFAALTATVAGCAAGGGNGVSLNSDTGGRYLVMIPSFPGPQGETVANELRGLVTGMATHVALSNGDVRTQMREYELTELNEVSARQLASIINVPLVAWGEVRESGAGLEADVKFVDSRSGDEINIQGVSGATPVDLSAAIFASFERSVEGMRQAVFCNDYLSSNQYEQALQNCESALAIAVTGSALYGKATALLNLDRNQEALAAYDDLLDLDPSHQDALLGAGLAASRLSQSEQAMGYYRRYLEINPGSAQVRMTVANDIAQTGDYVSAFRVLELGADDAADNEAFQGYLFQMGAAAGRALREQGDSAQARDVLTAAYQAYERGYGNAEEIDVAVTQRVIEVLASLGRSSDAIAIGEQALAGNPRDPQILSVYATALREAGRDQDEIDALTRLIEAQPDHETALIRRAQAHNRVGSRQAAIADLERYAQRDAQTAAQVLYNMGATEAQAQRWEQAASILEIAYRHATGSLRSDVSYLWGASVLQQALNVARANTTGNAQQFQQTIALLERSLQLLQGSQNPQAAQYIAPAQELLANQQGLLNSIRR